MTKVLHIEFYADLGQITWMEVRTIPLCGYCQNLKAVHVLIASAFRTQLRTY